MKNGRVAIVVPMKLWTPGLHGFRSKRLPSPMSMLPAQIPLCMLSDDRFANAEERLRLTNQLRVVCHSHSTFSYSFEELEWEEARKILFLAPEPMTLFADLKMKIREALDLEDDYRDAQKPRLVLAAESELSEYELKEEFYLMNGDLLPFRCRATELEVYWKKNADWLLCESIPFRESEAN